MMRNSSKKLSIYCMIGCMWYSGFIYCNSNFMSNKLVVIVPIVAVACGDARKGEKDLAAAYRQPHHEHVSGHSFVLPTGNHTVKKYRKHSFCFLLSCITIGTFGF